MKKWVLKILTAFLFFSVINVLPVQAQMPRTVNFYIPNNVAASREPSSHVFVPVRVGRNDGFSYVSLTVTFDPNVLRIREFTAGTAAMPFLPATALTQAQGRQEFSFRANDDWHESGSIVYMLFEVVPNAPLGRSNINLTINNRVITDEGIAVMYTSASAGSVNVIDRFANEPTFIGVPHTGAPTAAVPFGRVPQTGVPAPTGKIALMSLCFTSAILGTVLLRVTLKKRKNG